MASRVNRIVVYKMASMDVDSVIRRRNRVHDILRDPSYPTPWEGNVPCENDEYPMVIIRDWGGSVNGKVLLDGYDDLWVTSRAEGEQPGQWHWPVREEG